MSENNEILDRLLVEQTQSPRGEATLAQDDQVLITTSRVVNIRYRLYFLILLVVGFLFTYYIVLPAWNSFVSVQAEYSTLATQVVSFASKKKAMDTDKALIEKMENQSSLIVSCLNTKQWCKEIDPAIRENFSFARSYIQLNNLSLPRAMVNEKILLVNINEYLLKDVSGVKNGKLNAIRIGEPKNFEGNLYVVPVRLTVDFANKDAFLSFVDNVEKKILSNAQYRVLYKIVDVSYDITHYDEQQTVDISLNAYYYQD